MKIVTVVCATCSAQVFAIRARELTSSPATGRLLINQATRAHFLSCPEVDPARVYRIYLDGREIRELSEIVREKSAQDLKRTLGVP